MSRKHLSTALSLLLVLTIFAGVGWLGAATVQAQDVNLYIDGVQTFFPDQLPYIDENGRTLVPARFCSLALGASVSWDDERQQMIISRPAAGAAPARQTTLTIGSREMVMAGEGTQLMDTAAVLSNGRTMVPLRFISEFFAAQVVWDAPSRSAHVFTRGQTPAEQAAIIEKASLAGADLPCVNSAENLQDLLEKYGQTGVRYGVAQNMMKSMAVDEAAPLPAPQAEMPSNVKSDAGLAQSSFSATNVQVAGVDESDIVKTDGEYLYQVKDGEVIIVRANPPAEMQVVARIAVPQRPREMYIDHNRLVLIQDAGGYFYPAPVPRDMALNSIVPDIYPPPSNRTLVTVFDTGDKSRPAKVDEYATPGSYLSSRKIGVNIYIISTEGVYRPFEPVYSINDREFTKPYAEIRYFPDMQLNSYMNIASLRLNPAGNSFSLETFLGSGNNVYCSTENLYIAASHYRLPLYRENLPDGENTVVYKFGLGDEVSYKSRGLVPGRIFNQFSMDEYDGYFRIATTREEWNTAGAGNAVYILNPRLKQVSAVENIAPGERIYAARFMGPRAYLVTFKQVDPLFVIDMDPQNPKVLGKLKIPGFSSYLHPYKDRYLIGLGSEVEDTGKTTRITGLKLSLFDVGNVSNPIEVDKVVIGASGTRSEATDNHKAFMLYQDTLAFPATVYEGQGYGSFAFQGAYVYNVSPQGFALQGRITHLDEQDYLKAGDYWGGNNREIQRIVYIGGNLYTLSEDMIKANQSGTLAEQKRLLTD